MSKLLVEREMRSLFLSLTLFIQLFVVSRLKLNELFEENANFGNKEREKEREIVSSSETFSSFRFETTISSLYLP